MACKLRTVGLLQLDQMLEVNGLLICNCFNIVAAVDMKKLNLFCIEFSFEFQNDSWKVNMSVPY